MSHNLRILAASYLFLFAPAAFLPAYLRAQSPPNLPDAASQPYQQGLEAEENEHLDVALDRFQAALRQAPNSPLCYEAIVRVQTEMGDDKSALATTAKMISSATDAPTKAHAEMLEANIYYHQWSTYSGGSARDKDPKRADQSLRKSEAAIERASADDPGDEPLRMLHAHILADLHRDAEASQEFQACAAIPGTSPTECARALKLSRNAELARFEPSPSFKATTLDNQHVSLDSLAGKVVLIDFWGSWCRFCVRDSDYVQSMLDSFDPGSFVLLEVDEGDTSEAWLRYLKQNHLQGVQVQDSSQQLRSLFHVRSFPTYILLDGDGLVRMRVSGAVGDLRSSIRKIITVAPPASSPLASNEPLPQPSHCRSAPRRGSALLGQPRPESAMMIPRIQPNSNGATDH